MRPREACCHSDSSERPSADAGVKNLQRMKIKESEKRNEYLDLARNKKAVEHKVDGGTSCKWCKGGYKNRKSETIQITALLRSGGILRSVMEN